MEQKQTALVTGGAGFIGSHLCDHLLEKELKVVCVDNLATGSEENIKHLLEDKNFEFINADIVQPISYPLSAISYIYHLASPASPIDYQEKPEETAMVNSLGTLNMLKLAVEKKAQILIASTSEVYGDPKEHPQKETYWGNVNSFGPRACYDESKRFGETLTYIYLKKYALDGRIVRIFNTYGPRMQKDDGRVISNFINAALKDSLLKVDGDGSQTRSFCYVSDMVEGIYSAMTASNTEGEIFNLGNSDEYKVKDLAEKIIQMTKSKSKTEYNGKFREDDPMRRQPDITKARKTFGWEPKVSLEEGLKKTIEYYKGLNLGSSRQS